MKKALSLAIFLLGCLGIFAESVKVDGIYYELNTTDYTATVTTGGSYSGDIVIPETITYNSGTYNVTSIGVSTFHGCTGLTSVKIGNSVTSIGIYAFYGCTGLTSITIPNSVTRIESYAFQYCTGLTSITIPNSITSIESNAFRDCTNLTDVYINIVDFANSNRCYNIVRNCHYIYLYEGNEIKDEFVIPNSVKALGSYALYGCTGLTSVTIGNSVTSIGSDAFSGCTSLTSITLPNSVTTIEGGSFDGCI